MADNDILPAALIGPVGLEVKRTTDEAVIADLADDFARLYNASWRELSEDTEPRVRSAVALVLGDLKKLEIEARYDL